MQTTDSPENIDAGPGNAAHPSEIRATWLHPSSLIFELLSHFRELAIPIVIAIFSAAQGSLFGLYFALIFFIPAVMYSVFRYFTLRYSIHDGELVVRQGLIFRRVRTVPLDRIQNVDLVQNVLHRLFKVAEVRIETASGSEAEATLRVLSMKNVARLRDEIFRDDPHPVVNTATVDPPDEQVASVSRSPVGVTLLEIPSSWLLKAGLASNRGMLIIGILGGLYFQFDDQINLDWKQIRKFLPTIEANIIGFLMITGMVLAALLVLRLVGIVWFLLRFYGYRLALHGEDLRISCGLFTKISATVPRQRIQFISIHRPLFMRWMKLASIRIETAGGGSSFEENAKTTVSRRWFVPVVPEDYVSELLGFLRPGLGWDELAVDWKPLAARTGQRLMRLAFIQAVILAGIGIAITRPWGWAVSLAALPLLLWWARKKSRAMRYARTDQQVIYRSGVLNRKTSLTFFDKVQVLAVNQSPFDRRWQMACLSVDTAASGPAEHRIEVPYLDQDFARDEYEAITAVAANYQPDFG
ncbi:MAG: PH domain-containing protein [Pirellulaceae bacterium]